MTQQPAIQQVYMYIREHWRVGDKITTPIIRNRMPWLSTSAISSSLWTLDKGDYLDYIGREGSSNLYIVNNLLILGQLRGFQKSYKLGTKNNRSIGAKKGMKRRDIPVSRESLTKALENTKETLLTVTIQLEKIQNQIGGLK